MHNDQRCPYLPRLPLQNTKEQCPAYLAQTHAQSQLLMGLEATIHPYTCSHMHESSPTVPRHTEITYTGTFSRHHSPSSLSRTKSWPTPAIQQRRLALLCTTRPTSLSLLRTDPLASSINPRHKYMHSASCHSFMLFVFAFSHSNEHSGVDLLLSSLIHANQTSLNKSPQYSAINSKAWA